MSYRDDIKSKPGAPNNCRRKEKLYLPMDKETVNRRKSKGRKKAWKKQKAAGFSRTFAQKVRY